MDRHSKKIKSNTQTTSMTSKIAVWSMMMKKILKERIRKNKKEGLQILFLRYIIDGVREFTLLKILDFFGTVAIKIKTYLPECIFGYQNGQRFVAPMANPMEML